MRLYSTERGLMHRAGGRFSAWTFVQALRTNSPRPAPSGYKCQPPLGRASVSRSRRSPGAGARPQDRALAIRLLVFRRLVGAQPERDVSRLHRLPYHARKVVVQRLQVRLVAKPGREGFQGLPRVVLATVETAVYKRLDPAPQWVE